MSGDLYLVGAGALLQQMRLDTISNNLANVATVGYKQDKVVFRTNPRDQLPEAGLSPLPVAEQVISPYAPPMQQTLDFTQGPLQQTGNPLDVAIEGPGFFKVQTPQGIRYTRKGSFTLDSRGVLSTSEGYPVLGQGGPITIDGSRIEIHRDGTITVDGDEAGQLEVVDFARPYSLKRQGESLFAPGNGSIGEISTEDFTISQGFVERSNVEAIGAMTEMIETLRTFESYQKVMRSVDDAEAKTVNEVGKL